MYTVNHHLIQSQFKRIQLGTALWPFLTFRQTFGTQVLPRRIARYVHLTGNLPNTLAHFFVGEMGGMERDVKEIVTTPANVTPKGGEMIQKVKHLDCLADFREEMLQNGSLWKGCCEKFGHTRRFTAFFGGMFSILRGAMARFVEAEARGWRG